MLLETARLTWDMSEPLIEMVALIIIARMVIKASWAGLKILAGNIKDKIIKGI